MQEEVTQKTIALVIKTAKLDANVLKAAMRMYLNHRRQKAQKTHGKTSVKKLVGEGVGVSSIEVTDGNIKSFERVARKYNVDFAVKKDRTTDPPKYVVFFKGRDADAVAQAFKEFVYGNEKRKGRTSVREKLKRLKDAVSQNKNRERSREKNKDRGQISKESIVADGSKRQFKLYEFTERPSLKERLSEMRTRVLETSVRMDASNRGKKKEESL